LRWMCDPAKDGHSPDLWSPAIGKIDNHFSSGVGNLAFCLLSQGGVHPRGKTGVQVPGIGMDKAIRIAYKAQTSYLTSTSDYAAARVAMEQAATALAYDQATRDAVGCAWAAVGVGAAPASCGVVEVGDPFLASATPVTGLSGATSSARYWRVRVPAGKQLTISTSGGTGDVDLYTAFGARPTTSSYLCRPWRKGNLESCTVTSTQAGDYYVMLKGYVAYAGVTLVATY